jgi:hypothetical protein
MRADAVQFGLKKADKKRFDKALTEAAPEAEDARTALLAPREKLEALTASLLGRCDRVRDETVRELGFVLSDTASAGADGERFHLRPLRDGERAHADEGNKL